jgi:hypothetical protein
MTLYHKLKKLKNTLKEVSTDKGTQAPKPKTGTMESLDDTVSQAKEATKHVEGSETVELVLD